MGLPCKQLPTTKFVKCVVVVPTPGTLVPLFMVNDILHVEFEKMIDYKFTQSRNRHSKPWCGGGIAMNLSK